MAAGTGPARRGGTSLPGKVAGELVEVAVGRPEVNPLPVAVTPWWSDDLDPGGLKSVARGGYLAETASPSDTGPATVQSSEPNQQEENR
jgi:hypothetical protein